MLKHTLTAAALAAVLATPAFAQKQPAPDTHKQMQSAPAPQGAMSNHNDNQNGMTVKDASAQPAGFMQSQDANEWRGSKLIGASIYGPDNKSIGDVNDVLIAKDGRVTAVVVGVGGFLGVGEKNVALPFQALDVQRKADGSAIEKITVSYTKDQLKNAPKFAYYKGGQTETTGAKANESVNTPMTRDKSDKMMPNENDTMKHKK
jgi:sporulation protein YlmC with PRC-barrel domain